MSLQISEKKQDKLSVAVTANNLDGKLGDLPDPLPENSVDLICASLARLAQVKRICFILL
jgi:hypothetical protein